MQTTPTRLLRPLLDRTPRPVLRGVRAGVVRLRHRGLTPDDVIVAVYPKSGSTWTRFLITHALLGREVGWDELRSVSPPLGEHTRGPALLPRGGRLIKLHDAERHLGQRPPKVLHVVRDARDVAVSYYYQLQRQGWFSGSFDEFLPVFLRGDVDNFSAWHEHTLSWTAHRAAHPATTAMVRYEDLLEDAAPVLHEAMGRLGVDLPEPALAAAVEAHSVARMRSREKKAQIVQSSVADQSIPFVRAAKAGGWREEFGPRQLAHFQDIAGPGLLAAGYALEVADGGTDGRRPPG